MSGEDRWPEPRVVADTSQSQLPPTSAPTTPAGPCPHGCGRLWTGPDGAPRCPSTQDRAVFLAEEPDPDSLVSAFWTPPPDLRAAEALDASVLMVDLDWAAAAVASIYRPADPRRRDVVPVRVLHPTDLVTYSDLVEVKPMYAEDGTVFVALVLR